MEGMGIYIWNDGRVYSGQYKDDKKHGFGVYTWADGRCYEGFWYKGKQHGLGTYVVPKEQKLKYGLWEDGKRIEWFNDAQIKDIKNMQLDYTQFFHQTDSERMIEQNAAFRKPGMFEDKLSEVKRRIAKLNIKTGAQNFNNKGV